MKQEILKFCLEKGLLLDKETLGVLEDFDDETAKQLIEKISQLKEKVITKSFISKNVEKLREIVEDERVIDKLKINFGLSFEISRERLAGKETLGKEELKSISDGKKKGGELKLDDLRVIYSLANLTKKIDVDDFVKYFRVRYTQLRSFLQERKELEGLSSINKINGQRQAVSVIGMVSERRVTKNKNLLLEVEDLTGNIRILINRNKENIYEKAKGIIIDDVIGVSGFGDREIIFANDIVWPEAKLHEKVKLNKDESVAFISDIHIGSKNFLQKNFERFINWLNGEVGDEKQKKEALKIKYLLVTGDSIDGVGIFPGQDLLLDIEDIREQYNELAKYLKKIRKNIKIILCPGQHDAVRVAEPQPAIGVDYGRALHDIENVILVSNPALIEIGNNGGRGMRIMMYHGASMNSYINEIEGLRLGNAHDSPSKVAKEMLKRRHLASIHGSVTYIPNEKEDYLLIKEVPDVFVTGDLHKPDVDIYNNILIIASSCWQSMTPFEEKVGNHPDPCKVPVLNLKTREIKILDFSDDK